MSNKYWIACFLITCSSFLILWNQIMLFHNLYIYIVLAHLYINIIYPTLLKPRSTTLVVTSLMRSARTWTVRTSSPSGLL